MPPPIPNSSPDAAAIRLLSVPDSAPPYDGDTAIGGHHAAPAGPGPVLAGPPPAPPGDQVRPDSQRQRPRRAEGPGAAPEAWPGRFAQVLAETLAGSRSQGQIVPWTNAAARRRIRQLGPMLTAGAAPRIRRVMPTRPAADVVEMTVVVGFGDRVRALAVRLERDGPGHHGPGLDTARSRWVCTAIEAA